MDKALSIGSAVILALCVLYFVWFFSAGLTLDTRDKSLAVGLVAFGGPLGFWGGVGLVAAMGVAIYGLHELCNYWVGFAYVKLLQGQGHAGEELQGRIDRLPVSRGLKKRLKAAAARQGQPPQSAGHAAT
ncbi:MAG: hypothetical protein IMZ66_07350 [Planctomycetes bacterium]|nr:hypothetical protein [Planctomycetota bacterium]